MTVFSPQNTADNNEEEHTGFSCPVNIDAVFKCGICIQGESGYKMYICDMRFFFFWCILTTVRKLYISL